MGHQSLFRKTFAEFAGTFAIVFFGCGAIGIGASKIVIAGTFGLTVATMIYALGPLSGAHFNPAVTLAFLSAKKIRATALPAYWLAQFLGAGTASLALKFLFPNVKSVGLTLFTDAFPAFANEMLLTFFLMTVIYTVATDKRVPQWFAALAIGVTVGICAFIGGAVSGASMNPARTLGPALVAGSFSGIWLYFTAPFLGAVIAPLVYERIKI